MKGINLIILFITILTIGCSKKGDKDLEGFASSCVIVGDHEPDWIEATLTNLEQDQFKKSKVVGILDWGDKRRARCTAFLISPNVVMTNQHCIENSFSTLDARVSFDNGNTYFSCDDFIGNNQDLDYALLRCEGNPGKENGYLPLSNDLPQVDEDIYVIHQNCDYKEGDENCDPTKKLPIGILIEKTDKDNGEYDPIASDPNSIAHNADTLGGSSGAPVIFNATGEVVAIHNSGLIDFDTYLSTGINNGRGSKNGGIKMHFII